MKLKTTTIEFLGKDYPMDVFVHKDGLFVLRVPQAIRDKVRSESMVLKESVNGYCLETVVDELSAKIRAYEEDQLEEVKKKVIRYKIDLSGYFNIMVNGKRRGLRRNDVHNDGLGINFHYRVLWKAQKGKRTNYYDLDNDSTAYVNWEDVEIEWSKEREEFLKSIEKSIQRVMIRLDDFLNPRKNRKVFKLVDEAVKLLTE